MVYEVRRLRLLRELASHGTIAATAEACSLTPSAVSQQLLLLEREVGTALLVREGRGVILTEAARVLVASTERVLAELERARADVSALTSTVRGTVRLSSFPSAAVALAAPAIAACRAAHPDLRVLLDEREPEESVRGLRQHACDVALVYEYNLLPRLPDDGVRLRTLLREPLVTALPPHESPAPEGAPLALADLREKPWIAPHSDNALRTVLERACQQAGFEPRLDYTSDDYTVILSLVEAGLGVSLIPRLVAGPLSTDVRLCEVAGLRLTRTISVAVRAGAARDPAIAAVTAALTDAAAPPAP
ncbi:DNA-binding transcriptional LysR family regulator [Streptomyces sp. Amel2xB2]|uniref:LysR family transcriptional regulator n=1 Tax=Streptomyces sp. Amel2xB2 TaxID=1305829 RepID=UPI000DBA7EE9|nr:LysR family transcriptional regulator [Streptomyces sp. Amel2xB2]RAJ56548.1 DNA-binding transcriptional LysR family regulator [Streptomyces sp. Amel2xB2]